MDYSLRAVTIADAPRLLELLSLPAVFEFLSDGSPPAIRIVEGWVSAAVSGQPPLGLWLLTDSGNDLSGCVRLSHVSDGVASAELTYVLHPTKWGRGLATAMSRSVISRAFRVTSCESILAGADLANTRSIEVIRRLDMRFLRRVEYPAGPGVEYLLSRAGFASMSSDPSVSFD